MTDLPAQIIAAIEETEQIAQAATPGPWFAPGPDDIAEWSIFGDGWVIASAQYYPRTDMASAFPKLRKPATVIEHANRNAVHIAHNDPAIVLRMCAAHRATLAEHKPFPDGSGFADSLHCAVCLNQREIENDYPEYWTPQTYPCLTIRSLAAGYGIPLVEEDRTA